MDSMWTPDKLQMSICMEYSWSLGGVYVEFIWSNVEAKWSKYGVNQVHVEAMWS
jgi:hypothetical protein